MVSAGAPQLRNEEESTGCLKMNPKGSATIIRSMQKARGNNQIVVQISVRHSVLLKGVLKHWSNERSPQRENRKRELRAISMVASR